MYGSFFYVLQAPTTVRIPGTKYRFLAKFGSAVFQRQSTVRNIMFEVIRKLNFVVLGVLCKTNIQASTVASFLIEIDGPESQRQRLAQDLPLTFRPIFRPQRIFKKNSNFFLDIVNLVYYIDLQLNILFIAILDPVFLVQFLLFKSVHFFNFAQKGILPFHSPLRLRGGFSGLDSISCRSYGKVSSILSCLPHCIIHRVLECRTYLRASVSYTALTLLTNRQLWMPDITLARN